MQAEGDVIRFPLAEKEPADFSAFFAEEHRQLFKALFFVTGNRADAAELMQDAFMKLWERSRRTAAYRTARQPDGCLAFGPAGRGKPHFR